ncbi:MAG: shikimate kinase [Thermodesulfobacteriota bacterium]
MFDPLHKIILTGYRATGKSAVGSLLAVRRGLSFLEMDTCLEERAGRPIRQLVAEEGWESFRELERNLLAELVDQTNLVISTGGGAILHQEAWRRLMGTGLVVWLIADIDTICRRLTEDQKSEGQRPSLTGADICTEAAMVLAEREPLYAKGSHLSLGTDEDSVEAIVDRIEAALADAEFLRSVENSLPKDPLYC